MGATGQHDSAFPSDIGMAGWPPRSQNRWTMPAVVDENPFRVLVENGALKRVAVGVVALGGLAACAAVGLRPKADRDHDGIADERDLCPAEPETFNGYEDWDGCPDGPDPRKAALADDDHDGIANGQDLCPGEPEDRDGFQDDDGCPDPDNDRDRILDVSDRCPNEPETYNGFEDDDGCPEPRRETQLAALPGAGPPPPEAVPDTLAARFARHVAGLKDLDAAGLARRFHVPRDARGPSFDVARAKYFDLVTGALQMTPAERHLLETTGVASVDHRQRASMASVYWSIYARDLPVLITSDSILHALHRSFDEILQVLEVELFSPAIAGVLDRVEAKVRAAGDKAEDPTLRESLSDVDLYVTVARNLLAGGGSLPDEKSAQPPYEPVASATGVDVEVKALLERIASLNLAQPDGKSGTTLRGGVRLVDYSQFRPRGHYALSAPLRRYFRAMMWLGRPDLGFALGPSSGMKPDAARELRAAATLVLLLRQSGAGAALAEVTDVVDFLVGAADDVTLMDVAVALDRAGVASIEDLASAAKLARLGQEIARLTPARGQILGNIEISNPGDAPTSAPKVVQLFGQRFAIDSFVLSKVVYDSVPLREGEPRTMPTGLDVMAALGDGEAVTLLAPELDKYAYAPQLGAARLTIDEEPPSRWNATLYGTWLDALRKLHEPPAGTFPRALRTEAWKRKQLQTQLASWTELRHDTILYVKQSYGVIVGCSYPAAYVEPYPAFFARLADLARATAKRLRAIDLSTLDAAKAAGVPRAPRRPADVRDGQAAFLDAFAARMTVLERLAKKELAAQPFTAAETDDLKRAITRRFGSGGPRYDGWYTALIYGGAPAKWDPVVADVHTDPNPHPNQVGGRVLEEGTGDVTYLVVAVDNKADRAVYVGPAYSYYELEAAPNQRMTDAEWAAKLSSVQAPPRPAWTSAFQAPAVERSLAPAPDEVPGRLTPSKRR
jgi:hypothetical protein